MGTRPHTEYSNTLQPSSVYNKKTDRSLSMGTGSHTEYSHADLNGSSLPVSFRSVMRSVCMCPGLRRPPQPERAAGEPL